MLLWYVRSEICNKTLECRNYRNYLWEIGNMTLNFRNYIPYKQFLLVLKNRLLENAKSWPIESHEWFHRLNRFLKHFFSILTFATVRRSIIEIRTIRVCVIRNFSRDFYFWKCDPRKAVILHSHQKWLPKKSTSLSLIENDELLFFF